MYQRARRQSYRGVDYLMPFLIIICFGVIVVLLVYLFKAIFSPTVSGDVFMHIEEGSVQVKTWNTEEFLDLTSDVLLMEGDEVKTSAGAKIIVEFFDGTIMRIGGGSDVVLSEIDNSDKPVLEMILVDGILWFNKLYKDTGNTKITVKLGDTEVKSSMGNIFEVENEFEDTLRVLRGDGSDSEVNVDILGADGKVIETEKLEVGQEIVFTDVALAAYREFKSPSVIVPLDDEFKISTWYEWNSIEDKSPTEINKAAIMGKEEFVEVEPEVLAPAEGEVVEGEEGSVGEDGELSEVVSEEVADVVEETIADLGTLTVPAILTVAGGTEVNADGFYVVTSSLATLKGSVSGAEKVVVNNYTLQQFKPGDQMWTYFANADYDLMQVGENTYEVYALGSDGSRSESIFVKVLYNPPVVEEPVVEDKVEGDIPESEGVGDGVPID